MIEKLASRIVSDLESRRLRATVAVEVIPPVEDDDNTFISIQVAGQTKGWFIDVHPLKPGYDIFLGNELMGTELTGTEVSRYMVATLALPGGGFEDVSVPDFLPEDLT